MTDWNSIIKPQKGDIRAITPVTGTSVNAYTEIVDLDTRWLDQSIFVISNTAAVNEINYRVDVYSDYTNGKAFTTITDTIAVSDEHQIKLHRHARVKVFIKSTVEGSHSTYQVDCIAARS